MQGVDHDVEIAVPDALVVPQDALLLEAEPLGDRPAPAGCPCLPGSPRGSARARRTRSRSWPARRASSGRGPGAPLPASSRCRSCAPPTRSRGGRRRRDAAVEDEPPLKAVVVLQLLAGLADELRRPLERLAGRPGQPLREVRPVRLDEAVELLGIGLLQRPQVAVVRHAPGACRQSRRIPALAVPHALEARPTAR